MISVSTVACCGLAGSVWTKRYDGPFMQHQRAPCLFRPHTPLLSKESSIAAAYRTWFVVIGEIHLNETCPSWRALSPIVGSGVPLIVAFKIMGITEPASHLD